MTTEIASRNAVVIATNFNPSIVTERWLLSEGIVNDDEFDAGCVYTPPFVRVRSSVFDLVLMEERIQVTPHADQAQDAIDRLVTFIERLPHTPYKAVGLNFHYRVRLDAETADARARTLFLPEGGLVRQVFDDDGARFGGMVFVPSHGGKMKLEVVPATVPDPQAQQDTLLANFNFHFEIPADHENTDRSAIGFLRLWAALEQRSTEISDALIA